MKPSGMMEIMPAMTSGVIFFIMPTCLAGLDVKVGGQLHGLGGNSKSFLVLSQLFQTVLDAVIASGNSMGAVRSMLPICLNQLATPS
mgnify:CR=1 FL=1